MKRMKLKGRKIASRRALIVVWLMLLSLGLAACADNATPTELANATAASAAASTTTSQVVANTQLPTFTLAPTQPLATVTPAPTTTIANTTTTVAPAPTTTVATTTVADTTTTIAPTTTTAASTDTTTVAPTTDNPTTTVTDTPAPTTSTTVPIATTTTKPVATTKPATAKILPVFLPVLPALRRQKEVAVVLPTYLPASTAPIYAVFVRGEDPGYYVVLGSSSDCQGGAACRFGSVAGRPAIANEVLPGKAVSLDKGRITGHFVNAMCDANNCPDTTLTWKQGQGVYTVGIKAGTLDELTKMANSAIIAGQI